MQRFSRCLLTAGSLVRSPPGEPIFQGLRPFLLSPGVRRRPHFRAGDDSAPLIACGRRLEVYPSSEKFALDSGDLMWNSLRRKPAPANSLNQQPGRYARVQQLWNLPAVVQDRYDLFSQIVAAFLTEQPIQRCRFLEIGVWKPAILPNLVKRLGPIFDYVGVDPYGRFGLRSLSRVVLELAGRSRCSLRPRSRDVRGA